MTLRKQGHRQEDIDGRRGESNAEPDVSALSKTPLERRTHVVHAREVQRSFRSAREDRPVAAPLFQPIAVVSRMPDREVVGFILGDLDVPRVGARCIQETVAHHGSDRTRRDHRFRDEAVDRTENIPLADIASADGDNGIEREVPDEGGKPAENHSLQIGEKAKTPVQRRMQRSLAGRGAPRSKPGQPKPLVQQRGCPMHAIALDTAGSELDGQRHAVKLAAHVGNDGRLVVAELQLGAACAGSLNEELDGRKRLGDFCRQVGPLGRTGQGVEAVDILSIGLKRFAARRENVDVWRSREHRRCERGDRFDQMFAGIEDEQYPLVSEIGDDAGRRVAGLHRQSEKGGDDRTDQCRIADHAEIDKEDRPIETLHQPVSDGDCERRLANAAGPYDRQKACRLQSRRDFLDFDLAIDHRKADRQIGLLKGQRGGCLRFLIHRAGNLGNESIAAPGGGHDVAAAFVAPTKRLAKVGHMKAQGTFFDNQARPDLTQKLGFADQFVGPR
ncbi:hypothetical protein M2191_004903 [Bradyrhizobium japonicum]|nr:hypothetical protein [Bradyrhizobium japonicum]